MHPYEWEVLTGLAFEQHIIEFLDCDLEAIAKFDCVMDHHVNVDEGIPTTFHMFGCPAIEIPEVVVMLRLAIKLREDLPLNDM